MIYIRYFFILYVICYFVYIQNILLLALLFNDGLFGQFEVDCSCIIAFI